MKIAFSDRALFGYEGESLELITDLETLRLLGVDLDIIVDYADWDTANAVAKKYGAIFNRMVQRDADIEGDYYDMVVVGSISNFDEADVEGHSNWVWSDQWEREVHAMLKDLR